MNVRRLCIAWKYMRWWSAQLCSSCFAPNNERAAFYVPFYCVLFMNTAVFTHVSVLLLLLLLCTYVRTYMNTFFFFCSQETLGTTETTASTTTSASNEVRIWYTTAVVLHCTRMAHWLLLLVGTCVRSSQQSVTSRGHPPGADKIVVGGGRGEEAWNRTRQT